MAFAGSGQPASNSAIAQPAERLPSAKTQRQRAREQEQKAAEQEQQQKFNEEFSAAFKGANEGDIEATRALAVCYVYGRGTPKNEAEGLSAPV